MSGRVAEPTADGHYVVIDGRRWRATDPGIPEELRSELVAELMSARRAVRAKDPAARPRVQDAKVALGERGEPWWDCGADARAVRAAAIIRTLLRHRPADAGVTPTEIARVLAGEGYRALLAEVRVVVGQLQADAVLDVTCGGVAVDPSLGGRLRVSRGPGWPAEDRPS